MGNPCVKGVVEEKSGGERKPQLGSHVGDCIPLGVNGGIGAVLGSESARH